MNKKIILIVILVIAILGTAVFFLFNKKPPDNQSNTGQVWQEYKWEIIKFSYPSDGQVEKVYYGELQEWVGLIIHESGTPSTTQDVISIGGVLANCKTMDVPRCATFYNIPIYTRSADPKIVAVFDALLKTVEYNNPGSSFRINFPQKNETLEANSKYAILWDTKPNSNIPTVRIMISSTEEYWKEGPILAVDGAPNSGTYEWIVPGPANESAPYLIEISSCEYERATSSTCALRQGWSQPFFIEI